MNNFAGVTYVVTALLKPPIHRLIVWDDKLNKKFKELSDLVAYHGNYKNYRLKLQNIDEEKPCLPMVNIIAQDLRKTWLFGKEYKKNLESQVEWFKQLALMLRSFQQFYNRSDLYSFDVINSVFFVLPLVPEDIIMEYSHFQEPWPFWEKEKVNNEIYVDTSTFANLTVKLNLWEAAEAIPIFLDKYIWDEKSFMELLSPQGKKAKKANLLNLGLDDGSIGNILANIEGMNRVTLY
jgi:hypothetical protein